MATAKKSVASPPTRCDQGGKEVLVGVVPVEPGALVKLHLTLCRTAFRIIIFLDGELKLDQSPVADELEFLVPSLAPGFHNLHWAYLGAGTDWKIRSELSVNGAVRFRQRKSGDGNIPVKQTFLTLQVLS